MDTYVVVLDVFKSGYRYTLVVSAIIADSEQVAIDTASKGWAFEEEEGYEVQTTCVKLDGTPNQYIYSRG